MREGLEKCNRADVQPRPTGFAESKMDKCLKLKAGKVRVQHLLVKLCYNGISFPISSFEETEAVKRADLAIAQIQETLSFCLDGAESQLLARIRQTLSLPQNQKFP